MMDQIDKVLLTFQWLVFWDVQGLYGFTFFTNRIMIEDGEIEYTTVA